MPQPARAHIDAPLTNLSVSYDQSDTAFIFDKVFPVVPVDDISGIYWEFPLEDWLRDEAQRRAGGTESAGGGFGIAQNTYSATLYAWHKDIDDQTAKQVDNQLQLDKTSTKFVVSRLRLRQERAFISKFFGTGKWGLDLTGVASAPTANQFIQWNNEATSDPIKDIKKGIRQVLATTGFKPNTLVMGYDVWDTLTSHPDILDRIKYTTSDAISEEIVARYFEIDRLFVSTSLVNTAAEGLAASTSFNLGKSMLLAYSAPEPGIDTPSAGYQFRWKGVSDGLGSTIGTRRFRMEQLRADRIEGEVAFDNKIVAAPLGVFYSAVVA